MKTIFIDAEFKCYITNDGTMTAIETDFFDDKCQEFIEGYRFIPKGETWTRDDGEVFIGEMISPWKDYAELEKEQLEYEIEQLKAENAEYEAALTEIENALEVTSE